MKLFSYLVFCTVTVTYCLCVSGDDKGFNGNVWAVLVAGSNGYNNYRHQADVCHAYQVLKSHGVPDDRIVVMMYDDIANDSNNPTPGKIINHPNGKNVYDGVPKDYVGREVNPKNFLAILSGDEDLAAEGKKVVKSTSEDNVFVYFSDHGAPGLIAFPAGELVASDLIATLNEMHEQNSYKRLVFYLEACESGSMFEDLLDKEKNIYAVTAADPSESSYACYWDDERGTFLGDEFSVAWIEESERRANLDSESVEDQYHYLVNATKSSHVMEYGDLSVANLPLGHFQGEKVAKVVNSGVDELAQRKRDVVPSPDVPIIAAERLIKLAKDPFEKAKLTATYRAMVNAREYVKAIVSSLASKLRSHLSVYENLLATKRPISRRSCYEQLYRKFDERCFDVSKHPYALRFLYVLVNACENLVEETQENVDLLSRVIESHCGHNNSIDSIFASIQ